MLYLSILVALQIVVRENSSQNEVHGEIISAWVANEDF